MSECCAQRSIGAAAACAVMPIPLLSPAGKRGYRRAKINKIKGLEIDAKMAVEQNKYNVHIISGVVYSELVLHRRGI